MEDQFHFSFLQVANCTAKVMFRYNTSKFTAKLDNKLTFFLSTNFSIKWPTSNLNYGIWQY